MVRRKHCNLGIQKHHNLRWYTDYFFITTKNVPSYMSTGLRDFGMHSLYHFLTYYYLLTLLGRGYSEVFGMNRAPDMREL